MFVLVNACPTLWVQSHTSTDLRQKEEMNNNLKENILENICWIYCWLTLQKSSDDKDEWRGSMHVWVSVCVCVCECECLFLGACMGVCVCVCVCLCLGMGFEKTAVFGLLKVRQTNQAWKCPHNLYNIIFSRSFFLADGKERFLPSPYLSLCVCLSPSLSSSPSLSLSFSLSLSLSLLLARSLCLSVPLTYRNNYVWVSL